jgi:hypothetical protein
MNLVEAGVLDAVDFTATHLNVICTVILHYPLHLKYFDLIIPIFQLFLIKLYRFLIKMYVYFNY